MNLKNKNKNVLTIKVFLNYLQDFCFYELEFNCLYTNNQVKPDEGERQLWFTELFHHIVFWSVNILSLFLQSQIQE